MSPDLAPGELEISTHEVDVVDDGRLHPAMLILTDRRAILLATKRASQWVWLFGWIVALFAIASARARKSRLRAQIARDKFAAVETGEGGILVFHDTGDGYAHTSFAIKSSDSLAKWEARMHGWASRSTEARAPLPEARIVD